MTRAYGHIDSPYVPKLAEAAPDDTHAYVLFDSDAVTDLTQVLSVCAPHSVPYREGAALTCIVLEALGAAHGALRGGPYTLGGLDTRHLLVSRDGRLQVVGFGEGVVSTARSDLLPVLSIGGVPWTPASDVYGALLFVRSLIPFLADAPAPVVRILGGEPANAVERAFQECLGRFLSLATRADARAALSSMRRFWSWIGIEPDFPGLAKRLGAAAATVQRPVLRMSADSSRFSVDDGCVECLATMPVLRELLAILHEARLQRPGAFVIKVELFSRLWPGERPIGRSGENRLHVSISKLRKRGLDGILETYGSAYRLSPESPLERLVG